MAAKKAAYVPKMSDDAVKAKTAKSWAARFGTLDKARPGKLSHIEIASLLRHKLGVTGWWSQMLAVDYERGGVQ